MAMFTCHASTQPTRDVRLLTRRRDKKGMREGDDRARDVEIARGTETRVRRGRDVARDARERESKVRLFVRFSSRHRIFTFIIIISMAAFFLALVLLVFLVFFFFVELQAGVFSSRWCVLVLFKAFFGTKGAVVVFVDLFTMKR